MISRIASFLFIFVFAVSCVEQQATELSFEESDEIVNNEIPSDQADLMAPILFEPSSEETQDGYNVQLKTSEKAHCRYDFSDNSFHRMRYNLVGVNDYYSHKIFIRKIGLSSERLFIRCEDEKGNLNTQSFLLSLNQEIAKRENNSFEQVRTILGSKCISCHQPGGFAQFYDFSSLKSEEDWVKSKYVTAGKPYESSLYFRLKNSKGSQGPKNMPTTSQNISSQEAAIVESWIQSLKVADSLPRVRFASSTSMFGENSKEVKVKIVLDKPLQNRGYVTVNYKRSSAKSGVDFYFSKQEIAFNPGELDKTFAVYIVDDVISESSEGIVFGFERGVGVDFNANEEHALTITDNDIITTPQYSSVSFIQASSEHLENGQGAGVDITLDKPANVSGSVGLSVVSSNATKGVDYNFETMKLNFSAGEKTKRIPIQIINDSLVEGVEIISFELSNVKNLKIGKIPNHYFVIISEDVEKPVEDLTANASFESSSSKISEKIGEYLVNIVLDKPAKAKTIVEVFVKGGTATVGEDFNLVASEIVFEIGEMKKSTRLVVIDDTTIENEEQLLLGLRSKANSRILGISEHTLNISSDDQKVDDDEQIEATARAILVTNCKSCHGNNLAIKGLNVEDDNSLFDKVEKFIVKGEPDQSRVYLSLTGSNGVSSMPPSGTLSESDREAVRKWIAQLPKDIVEEEGIVCEEDEDIRGSLTRRLTQPEIRNSFDALLGREFMPDLGLIPADGKSGFGMTRNGHSQGGYSPQAIERLYGIFQSSIKKFIEAEGVTRNNNNQKHSVFSCKNLSGTSLNNCLDTNLVPLVYRAWRRPITLSEKSLIYNKFSGKTFTEGLEIVLATTFLSPRFLFISYDDNNAPRKLNNFEIAERLSFLIWARVPPLSLLETAKTKDLTVKENLLVEVRKLFDAGNVDRKTDLTRNYGWHFYLELQNQWLGLDKLNEFNPGFDVEYNTGHMWWANMFFIEEMFRKNRTIEQMFTDNFAVITQNIDHLYKAEFSQAVEAEYDIYHTPHSFRKVTFAKEERKGLLNQAAILAINSGADVAGEVNPTTRGLWHAGNILCDLPDGVPQDVAFGEDLPVGVSLKKKLEAHTEKGTTCFNCHKIMDPIGFGLWGFDTIGQTRDIDTWGFPVDPSGELEGQSFKTSSQMIDIIAKNKKTEECVMSHIVSFTVAEDIDAKRSCISKNILKDVKAKNGGLKDILEEIITSDLFLMRRK